MFLYWFELNLISIAGRTLQLELCEIFSAIELTVRMFVRTSVQSPRNNEIICYSRRFFRFILLFRAHCLVATFQCNPISRQFVCHRMDAHCRVLTYIYSTNFPFNAIEAGTKLKDNRLHIAAVAFTDTTNKVLFT